MITSLDDARVKRLASIVIVRSGFLTGGISGIARTIGLGIEDTVKFLKSLCHQGKIAIVTFPDDKESPNLYYLNPNFYPHKYRHLDPLLKHMFDRNNHKYDKKV